MKSLRHPFALAFSPRRLAQPDCHARRAPLQSVGLTSHARQLSAVGLPAHASGWQLRRAQQARTLEFLRAAGSNGVRIEQVCSLLGGVSANYSMGIAADLEDADTRVDFKFPDTPADTVIWVSISFGHDRYVDAAQQDGGAR